MQKIEYVIVTVIYKTIKDLPNFIKSLNEKITNYKLIVVNNHYSKEDDLLIKNYCLENDVDYIENENNGYGQGNNVGIKFAKENYDFKYLIISNSDVEIESFSSKYFNYKKKEIYGPMIKTLHNKNQNPYLAIRNIISEYFIYLGYKKFRKFFLILGFGFNKILRELFIFFNFILRRKKIKCFGVHGAFMIITRSLIDEFEELYSKDMFLFFEELYLANKLRKLKIKTYYLNTFKIKHFEDGTMNVSNINEKSELRKSFIIYYEKLK